MFHAPCRKGKALISWWVVLSGHLVSLLNHYTLGNRPEKPIYQNLTFMQALFCSRKARLRSIALYMGVSDFHTKKERKQNLQVLKKIAIFAIRKSRNQLPSKGILIKCINESKS